MIGRRLLWGLLVAAVAHLTAALGVAAVRPTPSAGPLMPAAGGALDTVAIQFHRTGAAVFLPVYRDLFEAMSPDTAVQVVVGDAEDQALFEAAVTEWFADGGGPTVAYTVVGRPITSWSRDRLAVLGAAGDTTLLAPPAPMVGPGERVGDWPIPWELAAALGEHVTARSAPFQFEGGDLIADEARVYVATPLLDRNPDVDRADLVRTIAATVGKPVVALGLDGTAVPDHHIGMFVTPLGGGRVAVADPAVGLALVEQDTLWVGGERLTVQRDAAELARFDAVIDQLEAEGLEVVRMPIVPSTTPYVWMSYNNALLEHRDGRLHVYMPAYGVEALDAAATRVWEGEGAVVHPIDVSALFRFGGSVRCVTAPVARR